MTHGKNIFGKVQCKDNGFIINVFTNKECTMHATKSGRPMRTPIYYGRCHKEGEGSKVYFIVNKLAPKMNAVDNDEDAGSDTTVNATKSSKNATLSKNATKAVNGTVNGTANGTNSTNLT